MMAMWAVLFSIVVEVQVCGAVPDGLPDLVVPAFVAP
jgi:hypothetical protein